MILDREQKKIKEKSSKIMEFNWGNIQYYAALHYIEEKYGVGALKELKTEKIISAGSPLNAFDLISYVKEKEIIKNPNSDNVIIKNDNLDLVTNIVGFNGTSIIARDKKLQEMIENKKIYGIKYDIWAPHSYYMYTTEPNSYVEYRAWQKPFIVLDKVLRIMDSDTYRKNNEKIEINKGADRNENIK